MSWDKGFDFRQTSGFVTDPTDCTYVLDTDTSPTVRNGVTFQWLDAPAGGRDRTILTGDPAKLAGINFGNTAQRFQVTLPSTGDYNIRIGVGDGGGAQFQMQVKIKDNTSLLATVGPLDTITSQFFDATGTLRGPFEAAWVANNVAIQLTFTTTTFIITLEGPPSVSNTTLSHLFISQIPPTNITVTPGVGSISLTGWLASLLIPQPARIIFRNRDYV